MLAPTLPLELTRALLGGEFGAEPHCTGRYDLETGPSSTCRELAGGMDAESEQCGACFTATGFNPAFYRAARVSPQQRRRSRQPHVVCLASFGVGTFEVGITHAPRRLSRLLEQGARVGAVIASFEDAETVRATRKRQLLATMAEDSRRFTLSIGSLLGREVRLQPQAGENHFTDQLELRF
jgi:uncharacterized protein DUF2797